VPKPRWGAIKGESLSRHCAKKGKSDGIKQGLKTPTGREKDKSLGGKYRGTGVLADEGVFMLLKGTSMMKRGEGHRGRSRWRVQRVKRGWQERKKANRSLA